MLYPLSYEGVRPISYLPGDTHGCAGVPPSPVRCPGAVSPLVEDVRSSCSPFATGLPGGAGRARR